jgi:hypothetical protein
VKTLVAALCLALSFGAYAQEKKEPTEAQKKQQQLMKNCNDRAGGKKGDERKIFLSTCLRQGAHAQSEAQKTQQARMSACNRQAGQKNLSGEARKSFMSSCLKGG